MTLTIAQMAEPYAVIECDDGYNLRVWSCAWGGEERTGGPRGDRLGWGLVGERLSRRTGRHDREATTMSASEAQVQRAIETLRERHRLTIDGDWGQTCNWDEFNWPCDTAIVLDALDAAIARAEAAERVVEAARSPFDGAQWRRWLNERSAMGKQWRRRDRLMEAVLDYDAARTPAESESTP